MTAIYALQAESPTSPLLPVEIQRRDLQPRDVAIDIYYAGICHSDIHTVRDEWAGTLYPIVPGHEIAGYVTAIGSEVTKHAVGDRVGIGCYVDSCGHCHACHHDMHQHCELGMVGTYNAIDKYGHPTLGGYSTHIVADEDYVFSIPEGVDLAEATPLMCAGITMYSPLRRFEAGPDKKVAIIGLGGLGHIGVKLAAAMGAEVTVLSQSLKKLEDGLRLGAHHYYATNDPATFDILGKTFDIIINTVSANIPVGDYLGMLKTGGALIEIGLPDKPIELSVPQIVLNKYTITGSLIGGLAETQEMLNFCAANNVGAEIEIISADKVNEAYDRTVAADVRYRFVIDTATLFPGGQRPEPTAATPS